MIEQWLYNKFARIATTTSGEWRVDCPFCETIQGSADHKQHMYISADMPLAHCFRCGWKGNYITLIMSLSGLPYSQAILELQDTKPNVGIFGRPYSPRGLAHSEIALPPNYQSLSDWTAKGNLERNAIMKYLTQRNVPLNIIRRSFGTVTGTQRAWIAIDQNWWTGRAILDGIIPKYINPPWPKGSALWNWQALGLYDEIVICEGVFGSLAIGANAIGLLGKSATLQQIERIVKVKPKHITLVLDSGAERDMEQVARQLVVAGYGGRLSLHYLETGQPDDGLTGHAIDWDFGAQVNAQFALKTV